MDNLYIAPESNTPLINLEANTGIFEISGLSQPQNAALFYKPVLKWLEMYLRSDIPKTTLHIKLNQFDLESSKFIFEFIYKLKTKMKCDIIWYYRDPIMREAGEDMSMMLGISFQFMDIKYDQ